MQHAHATTQSRFDPATARRCGLASTLAGNNQLPTLVTHCDRGLRYANGPVSVTLLPGFVVLLR